MERAFSNLLNSKSTIINLFILIRPWNSLIISLISILGYLLNSGSNSFEVFLLAAVFSGAYSSGAIINDIFDYEIDKINMPYRPLQRKHLSIKTATVFAFIFLIISFLLSINNSILFLGFVIFTLLAVCYSIPPINLVKRGILGTLTLSFVTVLIPGLTGFFLANPGNLTENFIVFMLLTIISFGVLTLKDFKDVKGDIEGNKKTIVILFGKEKALNLSKMLIFTFLPLSSVSFLLFSINYILLFFGLLFAIVVLYTTFPKNIDLLENIYYAENIFTKARLALLVYIIFALIGLILY